MSREELEKLTVTKLRDLAKEEYPEIQGVSGMKKDNIIVEILKARGEPVKEKKKKDVAKISDIKKQVRSLKHEKEKILAEKDSKKATQLRKQIKIRVRTFLFIGALRGNPPAQSFTSPHASSHTRPMQLPIDSCVV